MSESEKTQNVPQEKSKSNSKKNRLLTDMNKNISQYADSKGISKREESASLVHDSHVREGERVEVLDCKDIEPNPYQDRTYFPPEEIKELASLIKHNGQNQPIIVRKYGARYQIINGERRWKACSTLPQMTVEAIVRKASDLEMIYLCASENSGRKNISDYERRNTINNLRDMHQNIETITERLSISRSDYHKILKFNELDESVHNELKKNPRLLSRNEASKISVLMGEIDVGLHDDFNKELVKLIQGYGSGEIKSRSDIIKRLRAQFVVTPSRNREKVNKEWDMKKGEAVVGRVVNTRTEYRLTVHKSEVDMDTINELDKLIAEFLGRD